MIRGFSRIDTISIPAGAVQPFVTLTPRSAGVRRRIQHLHLLFSGGPAVPAIAGRVSCNVPGLEDLNGLGITGASAFFSLPLFADLRGDAGGVIAIENLTGGASNVTFGIDGYFVDSEADERAILPALESPSFVRSSATINVTTADTEMLDFQVPNYRGGVVLTHGLVASAAFLSTTLTFEGPGLEEIGPITLPSARVFPLTAWLPPLASERVLARRSAGASNSSVVLFGYGLP